MSAFKVFSSICCLQFVKKYKETIPSLNENKVYMRINFGSLLKFLNENQKANEFCLKIILYDNKNFVKCQIIIKENELYFLFDNGNVKKFKDEKELIGTICQKKFFDVICGR